jgi:hypothetical protein
LLSASALYVPDFSRGMSTESTKSEASLRQLVTLVDISEHAQSSDEEGQESISSGLLSKRSSIQQAVATQLNIEPIPLATATRSPGGSRTHLLDRGDSASPKKVASPLSATPPTVLSAYGHDCPTMTKSSASTPFASTLAGRLYQLSNLCCSVSQVWLFMDKSSMFLCPAWILTANFMYHHFSIDETHFLEEAMSPAVEEEAGFVHKATISLNASQFIIDLSF